MEKKQIKSAYSQPASKPAPIAQAHFVQDLKPPTATTQSRYHKRNINYANKLECELSQQSFTLLVSSNLR